MHFQWKKWVEATSNLLNLLEEFLSKVIVNNMSYLFTKLFDNTTIRTTVTLSDKWYKNLFFNLLKEFHFLFGLLLILLSLSSVIYSILCFYQVFHFNTVYAFVLRFLVVLPVLHRVIRYHLTKQPINLTSATTIKWLTN